MNFKEKYNAQLLSHHTKATVARTNKQEPTQASQLIDLARWPHRIKEMRTKTRYFSKQCHMEKECVSQRKDLLITVSKIQQE